ncbi:MAG TPA: hypothetical protein VHE59_16825 [Mucilaginibacter sp.]|nr:hypothetical protein [Mucilaginibacter sp.]
MPVKRYTYFLIIVLLVSCKKPQPIQTRLYTSLGIEVLNGHVKEIYSGDSSKQRSRYYRYSFDRNGNMISSKERLGADTSIYIDKRQYTVKYDKEGLIKAIIYNVSESGYSNAGYSDTLLFDSKGHLATRGNPLYSTGNIVHYKCDADGYVITDTLIYKDRFNAAEIDNYKYNDQHQLIETTFFEGNALLYKITFEYTEFDSKHNWTKRIDKIHDYLVPSPLPVTFTRKITYY